MDEYLPMFLAEGREHLQELNLAVVRIEENPDDPETVDEIFRIAHSMKGMSATMGFAGMAALTHEMEDVFELLRQRSGGLERAAIDVLFDSLDALSAAVEAIDQTGQEAIEPQALIERLQSLVRERTPTQEAVRAGAAPVPDNLSELADGRRVVQVTAILNDDVSMPSVRGYMVLAAIAELGETLACRPSPDEIDSFDGREIDAWVVSERTDTELQDAAASVPEVQEVMVFEAVSDVALDEGEPEIVDVDALQLAR
jgi:two-component system chemotaxis sensor kinase CheA